LATLASRSVTAPPRSPSAAAALSPSSHTSTLHSAQSQALRRPASVQIRSDPAPFLHSMRPTIAISSTPSFVPGTGRRSPPALHPSTVLHSSPSTGALRQEASLQAPAPSKNLMSRKSMPAMGLPPPAPPPDMPLPAPPPNMPLPAPPPNMPLPPPPTSASQSLLVWTDPLSLSVFFGVYGPSVFWKITKSRHFRIRFCLFQNLLLQDTKLVLFPCLALSFCVALLLFNVLLSFLFYTFSL